MDKILFLISIQVSISLPLIPVSKLILCNFVNSIKYYDLRYDITGTYLTFDKEAEFSFFPYEIYNVIKSYAPGIDEVYCSDKKIDVNETEYTALWCENNPSKLFSDINILTEKYSMKIPSSEMFVIYNGQYYLRFLSSKNVEHIVLDKELISFMNVEFLDNNDYIIHNEKCINEQII